MVIIMPEKEKVQYTTVNVNDSLLRFARKVAKKKQEDNTVRKLPQANETFSIGA
jgi:hypothetical protein